MNAVLDMLRSVMPYLLPVLLVVGQRLKALPFFANKFIPIALVVLNTGRLWIMRFGFAAPGAGEGQPLEPVGQVLGMPMFGLLAVAGLGGMLLDVVGFGAQLAVDHYLVNKAHKGLKYRALYKLAERTGLVQVGSSQSLKQQVRW